MPETTNLSSLKALQAEQKAKLAKSNTAYAGMTAPTRADQAAEARLKRISQMVQEQKDANIQSRWLDQQSEAPESGGSESVGVMSGLLNASLALQRGVVGAVESAVGKNPTAGFWENIGENMTTGKRSFSDLLKRSGLPGWFSGPAGFAADVATDPVNWAVAGTAALIPRMGVGFAKKGTKGLISGAKSGALEKANMLSKPVKGVARTGSYLKERASLLMKDAPKVAEVATEAGQAAVKTVPKLSNHTLAKIASKKSTNQMFSNLQKKAFDAEMDYVKTMDMDVQKMASQSWYRTHLKDASDRAIDAVPGGRELFEAFELSNPKWHRTAKIRESLLKQMGVGDELGAMLIKAANSGEAVDPTILKGVVDKLKSQPSATGAGLDVAMTAEKSIQIDRIADDLKAIEGAIGSDDILGRLQKMAAEMTEASERSLTSGRIFDDVHNAIENVETQLGGIKLTREDIKKIMSAGIMDETGAKWYDDLMGKIKKYERTFKVYDKQITVKGNEILDKYQGFINLFRVAKVGASPTAFTNSVVGNLIMAQMAGIKITPEYFKHVSNAWKSMHSTRSSEMVLSDVFSNPELAQYMKDNPRLFRSVVGSSPSQFGFKQRLDIAIKSGRDARLIPQTMTDEEAVKMLFSGIDEAAAKIPLSEGEAARQGTRVMRNGKPAETADQFYGAAEAGVGVESGTQNALREMTSSSPDLASIAVGMAPQEFYSSDWANKLFQAFEKNAQGPNASAGAKLANFVFNKMPSEYEKIDQSYRLGTITYLMNNGLSRAELNTFKRFLKLNPEDLSAAKNVGGEARYMLSADKAVEAAATIYLNYAAMPSAVKILRNIPILSSPFASFMYGMMLKTGQTAFYNPSAFNKVAFALKDFGGTKTPLEREALNSPYYERYKDQFMYRIPFFDENRIYYARMDALVPWATMNIFNPSERGLGNTPREKVVKWLDRVPLMKGPDGQLLMDTFIVPMILQDATPPGAFGQPIFPENASAGEKAFYAGRNVLESVTPGVAGFGGLLLPDVDIPGTDTSLINAYPSFKGRLLGFAKGGKNVYGKSGREPAGSRVIRSLLGMFGANVGAPMDTSYTSSEFKDEIEDLNK